MVSKRRDDLRDYMEEEFEFMAVVQSSSYETGRMIITDVSIPDDNGGFIIVASHLHLRNVNDKILRRLRVADIIIFKATVCKYKKDDGGGVFRNFALENVRCMKKIGGKYNGRK